MQLLLLVVVLVVVVVIVVVVVVVVVVVAIFKKIFGIHILYLGSHLVFLYINFLSDSPCDFDYYRFLL